MVALGTAFARGETGDESALATFESRIAPIALSANGQWLVYVDSKNVLHRVNLLDSKQAQQMALPVDALQLAASRTAQKVAFSYAGGCFGVVDFGSPALIPPTLTWVSRSVADQSEPVPEPKASFGSTQPDPKRCKEYDGRGVIALSTDGKLVANVNGVYDLEQQTQVATLPSSLDDIARRRTLGVQFTDSNRKLFLATASLGDGYEGGGGPSDMQFSIWDMASKGLFNVAGGARQSQFVPEMFLHAYSAQTGVLHFVDASRYFEARQDPTADSDAKPLLDVMQTNLHGCPTKTKRRAALTPWQWIGYAVDPLGRWIAGVRSLKGSAAPGGRGRGFVEEWVIVDASSGATLETTPLAESVTGLVAAPDGTAVYGLTAMQFDPRTGQRIAGTGRAMLRFQIPAAALNLPKPEAQAFSPVPCQIEDETASARAIQKTERWLKPRWVLKVQSPDNIRRAAEIEPAVCYSMGYDASGWAMHNGSVWQDRYSELAQLDWATGKTLGSLPTPRKRMVCSEVMPEVGGFISYQGDTVTFQVFEGVAGAKPTKQIVEVKPGWYVYRVSPPTGAPGGQRSFTVFWRTKPGTVVAKDKEGIALDMLASHYAVRTRLKTHEVQLNSESYEMGGYEFEGFPEPGQGRPTCDAKRAAAPSALGMEVSYFDSFRAYGCNAKNEVETVFWDGLSIAPQRAAASSDARVRLLAVSGAVGVVQSPDGHIRIYDLTARKELGHIQASGLDTVLGVLVNEALGMLVIESDDQLGGDRQRHLTGYSFR